MRRNKKATTKVKAASLKARKMPSALLGVAVAVAAAFAGLCNMDEILPSVGAQAQGNDQVLKCDPCIDRPTYSVKAIVHGTSDDLFWQQVRAAAVQAGQDLRVDLSFDLGETYDPDRMAAKIAEVSSSPDPPDALLVTIPSPAVEEAVTEVAAAGRVPVFGFNSGYDVAKRAGVLGFVAMDEYEGGVVAAREFLKTKNITRALFVNHQKGNTALDARLAGFKDTLLSASPSGGQVQVDEVVVDFEKDDDTHKTEMNAANKGCPFDAILLGGSATLELVTSSYYTNDCSFSDSLLATFDISTSVYDSIAVAKLSFAVSQQQHLQGSMGILMATLFATTKKMLAPSGESESGVYLSGPAITTMSNLPSDTVQTCEADAFPVCPNTRTPDGSRQSNCACTDRRKLKIGGVVHGYSTDEFWDHVFGAARQAALDMDVELEMPRFDPIENDPNRVKLQAKMASKMISLCQEGVDGLFVSLPGPDVFPAVRKCQEIGVPVMSVNAGAGYSQELGMMHHISQIELNAGYGAGELMMESGVTKGMYLNHKPGRKDVEDRGVGLNYSMVDAAAEGKDADFLGIVEVPFDLQAQYKKIVEDAVDRLNGGNWGNLGLLLGGASQVKEALEVYEDHPEVTIASFDTSQDIFSAVGEGKLLLGIDQEPYLQGYMPVVLLTWFAYTGQKLSNAFIESGPAFVLSSPSEDRKVCEANSFEVCPEPVDYEYNWLTSVRPAGLALFAIVAATAFGLTGWIFWNRKKRVVTASQPPFLYMICVGAVIISTTIIPLGIDDEIANDQGCDKACMAAPWLFFVGFTVAFSALFSKTWRINKLMHNASKFKRVKVTPKDVILPFVVLLSLNIVLLLTWTLVDPMKWERRSSCGSSELETYGICTMGSNGSVAIASCLAALNFLLIVLANYQAYVARKLTIEFEESKYIGLVMMSMMQISIIGVPVMFLVTENPEASYVIKVCLIFVLCMSMLLLIFIPKILHLRNFNKQKIGKQMAGKTGSGASFVDPNTRGSNMGLVVGSTLSTSTITGASSHVSKAKVLQLRELLREKGVDSDSYFEQAGIDFDASGTAGGMTSFKEFGHSSASDVVKSGNRRSSLGSVEEEKEQFADEEANNSSLALSTGDIDNEMKNDD